MADELFIKNRVLQLTKFLCNMLIENADDIKSKRIYNEYKIVQFSPA